MSELISQTLSHNIPDLYETEGVGDPICYVKLFTPDSNWTWYIMELSRDDQKTCFGYVVGLDSELGFFTLDELKSVHGPLGLAIERDMSFTPTSLTQVKKDEHESR